MKTVRNLFIEKVNPHFRGLTGQTSGLTVTADMIQENVNNSVKVVINNLSHIKLAIQRFKPVNVISVGMVLNHSESKELTSFYPHVNFYTMVHSNIPFSAVIGDETKRVYESLESGIKVIFNDDRYADAMGGIFLPNIYSKPMQPKISNPIKDELNVICGGVVRPFKNHVIQAHAAIKYANELGVKLNFHCNLGINHGGQFVLGNLKTIFRYNKKHTLINLPWQKNSEFVKSLRNYHIGMQVSLSESFNATAADYVTAGLPMVVSNEVRWASEGCKADAHSVKDIVQKMREAENHVAESQSNLIHYADNAINMWNTFLNG